MEVMVTGGAGFIGYHLVRRLYNQGHNVHVFDACTYAAHNYDKLDPYTVATVHGDVTDTKALFGIFETEEFDICYHLAAESHVDASLKKPSKAMATNAVGTMNVARFCSTYKVPMVYCSTDEVYGDLDNSEWDLVGADEYRTPICPSSPYSAGKAAGEHAVLACSRSFGLDASITRGCNAFGEHQYPEKLLPIMCRLLQRGKPVPLHGGGDQVRQWVAVEEFATALTHVGEHLLDGHPGIFNIAGPERLSVDGLVKIFSKHINFAGFYGDIVPDRPGQDRSYSLSGTRMTETLGFTPQIKITECAERLFKAYPAAGILKLAEFMDDMATAI